MNRKALGVIAAVLLLSSVALAQESTDPFPTPIPATDGVISVKFAEFATIPDFNGAHAPHHDDAVRAGHAALFRQRHEREAVSRSVPTARR